MSDIREQLTKALMDFSEGIRLRSELSFLYDPDEWVPAIGETVYEHYSTNDFVADPDLSDPLKDGVGRIISVDGDLILVKLNDGVIKRLPLISIYGLD